MGKQLPTIRLPYDCGCELLFELYIAGGGFRVSETIDLCDYHFGAVEAFYDSMNLISEEHDE